MRNKHILLILGVVLINLLGRTWRYIPRYYKSLGYVTSINILYYILCRRHLVWEFHPKGVHWWLLRGIHIFVVTPLLTLSFLAKLPSSISKQIWYIIKWVLVSSGLEYISHKQHLIQYKHGWNGFWSGILFLKMYVYSYLFSKKPLLTWILTFCSASFFVFKFKIPLRKHTFSRRFNIMVDIFYHTFLEDIF